MNNQSKGILLFALAMIISGSIGLFVKYVNLQSLDIVFFRCLFGSIALAFYVFLFDKISLKSIFGNFWYLLLSALILVFNWVFLFAAFKHTSLSVAISIYYLAPIFVLLYGIFILKEKRYIGVKLITIIIAFIGAILVSGIDGFGNANFQGVLDAFIASLLYASLVIVAKRLKNIKSSHIALFQTLIGVIVLYFFSSEHLFDKNLQYSILITLGVVHTALMYILFFKGIHLAPVSMVAIVGFLDPLIAVLLDFTILHSKLSFSQILGIIFIMGALLFKTVYEYRA